MDDVIYGVFAYSSSFDDDDHTGKKRLKMGRNKDTSNFTKPMNFVTGTINPDAEKEAAVEAEEADYSDTPTTGLGLRVSSSNRKETQKDEDKTDDGFLPTAFGRTLIEKAEQRRERERENKARLAAAEKGARVSSYKKKDGNVAVFEKYTKGIGSKLLEKMGYKGGGLGINEQGIVAPIDVKLRPSKMGMGYKDYKEATLPTLKELEEKKALSERRVVFESDKQKLWSKEINKKTKRKRDYITAEEMLHRKKEQGLEVIHKVFDMRGPQVRVLTNLENLNAEEKARENDIPMPELRHNVRLMVDLAELDVQKIDQDLRNERETLVALQKEKEKFESEASRQKKQLNNMENIARLLDKLEEENAVGKLTLDSLAKAFGDMQRRYPDDYIICNLSYVACSFAVPLFISLFQGWDPLQNPTYGVSAVSVWKDLLQGEECFDFCDASSPYTQLFMEVVFPVVRISVTNTWQARVPEPMLRLLETWEELMPPSVLQSILDNIVMPKLSSAVDLWDPRQDTIHIHAWMHPWLPLLGQKLETFYHTICNRLESVHAGHPSNMSAYSLLSPWKTVFDPVSWEKLMVRSILPKLLEVMHKFEVNPGNQKLDQFHCIMTWATAIPIHHMIHLLDIFFDKWQLALSHWLCLKPSFEDVRQWFLGWMEQIPQELLANEHVTYRVNLGLQMMDQFADGKDVVQPGLGENFSYLRKLEQRKFDAQQQKAAATSQSRVNVTSQMEGLKMSLKDVIQEYAQCNGLLFKPKPGRMQDGHQIYAFGNTSIIVDSLNEKMYAQVEDRWVLVYLEQLLEMQSSGLKRR